MENHELRIAHSPEAATDEPASFANSGDSPGDLRGDSYFSPPPAEDDRPPCGNVTVPIPAVLIPAFDPVPLRYRSDGLTPAKQRDFVEALADCGLLHVAAKRVGVSPQAVNRTRRRADAKGFDLACIAARRFGARRLHDTAWERAIEGSIRRHYYHGELKSEERVFDNKLLVYLLGKTEHLLEEPPEAAAVAANWEPWVEAIEQGTPLPDVRPDWQKEQDERLAEDAAAEDEDEEDEAASDDDMVWEDEETGVWWTRFPPPADFWGEEFGEPGDADYRRFLTDAEQEALEAQTEEDEGEDGARADRIRRACERRDRYFGFAGGLDATMLDEGLTDAVEQAGDGGFLFAKEAEPSETSETSAPTASDPERASEPAPDLIRGPTSPSPESTPAAPEPAGADHYEASWPRAPGGPLWTGTAEELEAAARGEEPAPEPAPEEEHRPRVWRLG